jgi:hypothetical protein
MPDLETLDTTGYIFTDVKVKVSILSADFGEGYEAAATIGGGLRTWVMKIDVLPDNFTDAVPVQGTQETRAAYLWNFFLRSKLAGNQPFRFRHADPGQQEQEWLACFVDDELSYSILCSRIFSTGLQLRQRRLRSQDSPGVPTDEQNPDQI